MPKYIDADVLIQKLQERYDGLIEQSGAEDDYTRGYGAAIDAIGIITLREKADVQEVKRAKWEHYGEYCQCSNCEYVTDDICFTADMDSGYYTVLPHYCSNCGCKMEDS